jgi:hypothetical protein
VTVTGAAVPFINANVFTGATVPWFGPPESVQVCTNNSGNCGTPIDTAVVTVNGVPLAYNAASGVYEGNTLVALGATVTVQVTIGADTYTATGIMYTQAPTIATPAPDASWLSTVSNTIAWTGGAPTTDPNTGYFCGITDAGGSSLYWNATSPPGISVATVPAYTLSSGSYSVFTMIGMGGNGIQFLPNTAANSGLWLGAFSTHVPITVP